MTKVRPRGEDIRKYILEHVESNPAGISKAVSAHFQVTRQAANKHMQRLTEEGCLTESGNTRGRIYKIAAISTWSKTYEISQQPEEHVVWTNDIKPALGHLPQNAMDIWHYGFTEIFNNAIEHSEGKKILVAISKSATHAEMSILDDGVGIFRKIQTRMNLLDERHAIFELSKGKLTTDPKHHTGEGIFFTSRAFDAFNIFAGGVHFNHEYADPEDWIIAMKDQIAGTMVMLKLHNHGARTLTKLFDSFTSDDADHGFTKTVVPVALATYGNDALISRSQAKRVVARVELFKTVLFDYRDVPTIGQAFADEIYRVFANAHPEIEIVSIHASPEVTQMISRAKTSNIES